MERAARDDVDRNVSWHGSRRTPDKYIEECGLREAGEPWRSPRRIGRSDVPFGKIIVVALRRSRISAGPEQGGETRGLLC